MQQVYLKVKHTAQYLHTRLGHFSAGEFLSLLPTNTYTINRYLLKYLYPYNLHRYTTSHILIEVEFLSLLPTNNYTTYLSFIN